MPAGRVLPRAVSSSMVGNLLVSRLAQIAAISSAKTTPKATKTRPNDGRLFDRISPIMNGFG